MTHRIYFFCYRNDEKSFKHVKVSSLVFLDGSEMTTFVNDEKSGNLHRDCFSTDYKLKIRSTIEKGIPKNLQYGKKPDILSFAVSI